MTGVLGGLFSSTTRGTNNAQQQGTASNQYGLTPQANELGQQVASLFSNGPTASAPVNQWQTGAANNQQGVAGNPAFGTGFNVAQNVAQNGLTGSLIQQQLSPYIQSVVNPTLQAFQQQNQAALSDLNGSQAQRGAFGNNTGAQAALYARLLPQQNAQIAGLFNTGYQNAQTAALQSLQAQLQGTGAIGNLSQANTGANTGLGQIGQNIWQSNYQNSLLPYTTAGLTTSAFAPLVQGSGSNQTTSGTSSGSYTGTQTPSPFSQFMSLAGLGSAGYDWWNQPSPKAANGGAIIGRASGGPVSGLGGGEDFAAKVERAFQAVHRMRGGRVHYDAGGEVNPWQTTVNPVVQGMQPFNLSDRLSALGRQSGMQPNTNQNGNQQQTDPGLAALLNTQAGLRATLDGLSRSGRQGMADGGPLLTDTIAEWGAWPAAAAAHAYWRMFGSQPPPAAVQAPAAQPAPTADPPAPQNDPSAGHMVGFQTPYNGLYPNPFSNWTDNREVRMPYSSLDTAPRINPDPFSQFVPQTNMFPDALAHAPDAPGYQASVPLTSEIPTQPNPMGLRGPDPNSSPTTDQPRPNPYVRAALDKRAQEAPQADPNSARAPWSPLTLALAGAGTPEMQNMARQITADQQARVAAENLQRQLMNDREQQEHQAAVLRETVRHNQQVESPELARNLALTGLTPGTPEYQRAALHILNRRDTESAYDIAIAQASAKEAEARQAQITASQGRLQNLSNLEALVNNPNLPQGRFADWEVEGRRLATAAGFNVAGVPEAEAFRALSNQSALALRNTANGEGMPGAMSDQDRNFLLQSVVRLQNTRPGNQLMLRIMRETEQYRIRANEEAARYIHQRRTNAGLTEHMTAWMRQNPMEQVIPSNRETRELVQQQAPAPEPNQAQTTNFQGYTREQLAGMPNGPVLTPNGQHTGQILVNGNIIPAQGALGTQGNPFPRQADVTEPGQYAYEGGKLWRRTNNIFTDRWEEVRQ